MSVGAVHWALQQTTDQPVDKLILIAIANFAGEGDASWPSRATLAKAGMCSLDTVDRANKRLVRAGLLIIEKRSRENGSRTSNCYVLNVQNMVATHTPPQPQIAATPAAYGAAPIEPSVEEEEEVEVRVQGKEENNLYTSLGDAAREEVQCRVQGKGRVQTKILDLKEVRRTARSSP